MTREDYHTLVATYDERKQQALIDAIPMNVNRAGKYYQRLVKQIYENTISQRSNSELYTRPTETHQPNSRN